MAVDAQLENNWSFIKTKKKSRLNFDVIIEVMNKILDI
jgi:hypothetical protein